MKYDLSTQKSTFYRGALENIAFLCQNSNGTYVATVGEGKTPTVQIWDMDECKMIKSFTSEVGEVRSIGFNCDSSLLSVFGLDAHNRTKALVYDVSAIHQGKDPMLIAKQLTDFDVL